MSQDVQTSEISQIFPLEEIANLAKEGGRPAETLANVCALIAKRFETNVCSVYLLESDRNNLVLAATVAAPDALDELRSEVDDLVCLISEEPFNAIGLFYVDFHQMNDAEVTEILSRFTS